MVFFFLIFHIKNINIVGFKLALTESEITNDLNYIKGIITERKEEKPEENKIIEIEKKADSNKIEQEILSNSSNQKDSDIQNIDDLSDNNSKTNEDDKKRTGDNILIKKKNNKNYGLRKQQMKSLNKMEIFDDDKPGRVLRNRKR